MQVLVDFSGAVTWDEFIFYCQVHLALKQLVIDVLVADVEENAVELDNELFALLVKGEVFLFQTVGRVLALFQTRLQICYLVLHARIHGCLFLHL